MDSGPVRLTQQAFSTKSLLSSEQLNKLILDNTSCLIAIHRMADLKYEYVNSALIQSLGYSQEELFTKSALELVHPEDMQRVMQTMKERLSVGISHDEFRYQRKDGTFIWLEATGVILPVENEDPFLIIIAQDISIRKQMEASLQKQIAAQNILLDVSRYFANIDPFNIDAMITLTLKQIGEFDKSDRCYVFLFSGDGTTMSNTHEWCADGIIPEIENLKDLPTSMFPWWMDKLQRGENIYIPSVANLPPEAQAEKDILEAQDIQSLFIAPIFADNKLLGYIGFDSVKTQRDWSPENIVILESVASIIAKGIQRKFYADALEASENYYRTIFQNTGTASMIIEEDMTISKVNDQCGRLLDYSHEDLIGKPALDIIPDNCAEMIIDFHHRRRINPEGVPKQYDIQLIDGHDQLRDGILQVELIPGTMKSVVAFIDMTEFRRIDRALKAISAINATIIHTENEKELLASVCQKFIDLGGYSMAWIGYLLDTPEGKVKPLAYAGRNNGFTHKLNITMIDPKRNYGPAAMAIRKKLPQVCRNLKMDPEYKPWAKHALRRGFKACMAIPLLDGKKAFGVIEIYSDDMDVFNQAEKHLLTEMSENLSYAIVSLRARKNVRKAKDDLEESLAKMQRLLLQSVTALGTALDIRDPYTAGHQRKVVLLATAIAEEIGFSRHQIEGIEVAGNLHDIGKINVPSEILSKPGILSEIEFAHIKTHPQSGYEIVKDIDFPWPIAEIVLQHHERMDGSGYPRGLRGDEILQEARILAVADVVEAMASHRPYRPAMGIPSALEELESNKGILYDAQIVEACLRLFREKGFSL